MLPIPGPPLPRQVLPLRFRGSDRGQRSPWRRCVQFGICGGDDDVGVGNDVGIEDDVDGGVGRDPITNHRQS